jgi:hypothetical protein
VIKLDGESPCRIVGKGEVHVSEVGDEASRQSVGEGEVDVAKVGGKAPR